MESLGSDDVFSENWQSSALVKHEIKIEKFSEEEVEVAKENSILSRKNTTFNEANLRLRVNNEKLQFQSVVSIERLPIVVKAENDINVDLVNDYSLEEEDYDYLIDKCNEKIIKKEHLAESKIIVQEEFDIKDEDEEAINEEHLVESEILIQEQFDIKDEDEETIKEEHLVESEILVQEQFDIKDEDEGNHFIAKWAIGQIKKQHYPSNRTGAPLFKCFNCNYQTHQKDFIAQHVLIHMRKTLECHHCSYKTRDKYRFSRHKLVHTPKEQVKKLHQCPECTYTSIWKCNITRHMVKHKKADDAVWYQCPECPFKTKHLRYLTAQHMLIHKKDAPMHKCTLCSYEGSQKSELTKHIQRVHRPKDTQLVRCQEEGCSFKTHYKSYLRRHIRVMHECKRFFTCSKCSYQTKHTQRFKEHELKHEDRNKWFSCTLCPYQTTSTTTLKRHMLVHKSASESKWFQCTECTFKTKYSNSLTQHKLIHSLKSEKVFKCSECSYKTLRVQNFRVHRLLHKKPEEIREWFYCYMCAWRTPRKHALARHIRRTHRGTKGRINYS